MNLAIISPSGATAARASVAALVANLAAHAYAHRRSMAALPCT